ncbi:hypothetical protein CB0940_05059 [Cercospora beticola]|uniref:Uncharacterized protein n=1 Tax=Cercospora beticola TaxID=122368 RepID=A0A2G5HMT4_CERBT|nr:hypothetical protein CB0940_05059 [Cercospora beticola]PIA93857.1 hypothetical protein CB0940_05059 [Cercospora beticola]
MQSLTPQDPSKSPLDLVPGDRLDYVFSNGKVVCTVRENSPRRIAWTASLGYINGEHYWTFEPDSSSPGNTILHHGEEFGGPLAFLMGDNFIARMSGAKSWVEKSNNDFNKDFRKWIEEGEEGVRKAATTSL